MVSQEKRLNKEQVEAIKHKNGPLLIIAGAGTGKTTVITERIKYLILGKFAKPSEVLALTFTEKAAREMETRVDEVMPYGYTQMWVSTFHSFCDRILRSEALHIGLDPKYKLMSQAEAVQFIRNNLFKFDLDYFRPLGNPTKFVDGMLQHFSRLQDEDVSPSDYIAWVNSKSKTLNPKFKKEKQLELKQYKELAKAFKVYDELKVKEGLMDFGDMIVKTLQLFRQRQNILKKYQKQFKYILVDEFQDTNYAQNQLSLLLAKKSKNITACGDDDQSIYRFRGAAVSNIIQFRKNFPKAKIVVLTKNYRSTQEILDRSYDLIQHNNPDRLEVVEKIDKRLQSMSKPKENTEPISFIHADRVENEADLVAKEIISLTQKKKYNFKDVAILVRANNHAEPFGRALSRKGIPYQFLGPGRLFKQPEVIDLISYLKVLYNFEDSVALYRVLSMENFDISARDLAAIGNYAKRFRVSLFEACEKADSLFISSETKVKVKKILEIIIKHLKLLRKETAGQLLYYFLQDNELLTKLLNPKTIGAEKRAMNISKFFDKLKTYEVDHEDATINAVVDWLMLSSELGESPLAADNDWTDINAVNILTVHSAKGLEFPVVFLINLVAQRFPTIERREQIPISDSLIKEILPVGDFHIEEERRLFYVGMTRAKDLLYLTAADYYGEGKREKRISPFVAESLGEKVLQSTQKSEKIKQLSFLDYTVSEQSVINNQQSEIRINYLSYSQIETFRTCPLHYKLKYILNIPTPSSAAQSFGTSMHSTLKNFYLEIGKGEKPTKQLLYKSLKDNWVREGFSGKIHEERFIERAKKYLDEYYKKEFNPKYIPEYMELPFSIPLSQGQFPLKVGGKIDRVDILPDGKIEIIDYKTGANIPTQKDVHHDLQLTFYALAATSIKEPPFNKKPEDIILTLYYFDNQTKISTTRTKEQLDKAKEEIFEIREQIEKSDFTCSGNILCKSCEYALMCRVEE